MSPGADAHAASAHSPSAPTPSVKERRRGRILRAATELLDERGGEGFTFDQVAERADLSRRTIFNYFPSIDDLTVAVLADMLGGLIELVDQELPLTRWAHSPGGQGQVITAPSDSSAEQAVMDELCEAIRGDMVVHALVRLTNALGGLSLDDQRIATVVEAACANVAARMAANIAERNPDIDRLELDLVCASLIHGIPVLYRHWSAATGAANTAESFAVWGRLLDVHLACLRAGYLIPDRPSPASVDPS